MVMEPKSHSITNDPRNWASVEESVQDMIEDFRYLESCYVRAYTHPKRT